MNEHYISGYIKLYIWHTCKYNINKQFLQFSLISFHYCARFIVTICDQVSATCYWYIPVFVLPNQAYIKL